MAEELQSYYLQLQQVEAALLTDAKNRELLKLKADLEEVIALSRDLRTQAEEDSVNNDDFSTYASCSRRTYSLKTESHLITKEWQVGDKCLAKWKENSQFYEAMIDFISADGQVSVTFLAYQNRSTVTLDELKQVKENPFIDVHGDRKKHLKLIQREYLKKKKLKKQQRFRELEEEREVEKNKWLAFATKGVRKGVRAKSIFASPDNVNGRVGIGTCGMSGRPMTEFVTAEEWKKN